MALKPFIVRGTHGRTKTRRDSSRWWKRQASRARRLAWKRQGEDAHKRCLHGWAD